MATEHRIRTQRALREAEGYLELNMPLSALKVLQRMADPGTSRGHRQLLIGEALRALERYDEAVGPLTEAADQMPSSTQAFLALGWCQKRLGRLDLAIEALERARDVDPEQGITHYNLACYLSLAGDTQRAVDELSQAIAIEPNFREMVHAESDFDRIRSDPGFQSLTGGLLA